MSVPRRRASAFQVMCLALLSLLDQAADQLEPEEQDALLDILAVRIARHFVSRALGADDDEKRAA